MTLTCIAMESGNLYTSTHGFRELRLPKGYRLNIGEQIDSATVEEWHEPWNGEGLPPVGTVCDLRRQDGGWGPATIKYMSKTIRADLDCRSPKARRMWYCSCT